MTDTNVEVGLEMDEGLANEIEGMKQSVTIVPRNHILLVAMHGQDRNRERKRDTSLLLSVWVLLEHHTAE